MFFLLDSESLRNEVQLTRRALLLATLHRSDCKFRQGDPWLNWPDLRAAFRVLLAETAAGQQRPLRAIAFAFVSFPTGVAASLPVPPVPADACGFCTVGST